MMDFNKWSDILNATSKRDDNIWITTNPIQYNGLILNPSFEKMNRFPVNTYNYDYCCKCINDEEEKPMRNTMKGCMKETKFKPGCYDNTDIPFIDRVETYNNRVVKVTFIDGTFTKSVCSENDTFDLDVGITICLMKRWLGKDGNRLYNNLIRNVHKRMDQKERLAEREKKIRAEMREKERKMKAKREAKKEKARQEQIEIQKQAYIEALKAAGGIDGREDDLK